MFTAYCCCFGDESEHIPAEVPLSQVLPDRHDAAWVTSDEEEAPEAGFFFVSCLTDVHILLSIRYEFFQG